MRLRAIAVVHRQAMVAEGIAAALSGCPWIASVATATTAGEGEEIGSRADAVAIDTELPDGEMLAAGLGRKGVRVVRLSPNGDRPEDDRLSVTLTAPVARLLSALVPEAADLEPSRGPLTPREREVLALVARGLAGKQVARHLGISPKTVEMHKSRIYSKLRVPNQAAAVRFAVSGGLVSPANGATHGAS